MLVEYCFLILCSTVIYRVATEVYNYELSPFRSYRAIQAGGHDELIEEALMNAALGVPLGFLLSRRLWWKAGLVGFCFSSVIELSQLVFKREQCEFDDVFHNTLGCLIGYGIGVLMMEVINSIRKGTDA
ncbi:VanZ family protein [Bacteroides uniformis]|uniref:VanZ family protein n=1 Tax=Bacteroides uniformis TaxID=820 RepID=UPI00374E022D